MILAIDSQSCGRRLDVLVYEYFEGSDVSESLSRSRIQRLIDEGGITVNGSLSKPSYRLREGDEVSVTLPDSRPVDIQAVDIPLDIIYEDDDIIIVNKPKGMVVHPAPGHYDDTLVNALLHHCRGSLSGINGVERPGIVHRIDRDTTGSLIICKNDAAHASISEQLSAHSISREYEAIVYGHFSDWEGTVDSAIGRDPADRKRMSVHSRQGRRAVTHYSVVEEFTGFSLVRCRLETGRTHQIRVHMTSINHPLLGDEVYRTGYKPPKGLPFALQGQCLHAELIGFNHPSTGEYVEFRAQRPEYFQRLIEYLRGR